MLLPYRIAIPPTALRLTSYPPARQLLHKGCQYEVFKVVLEEVLKVFIYLVVLFVLIYLDSNVCLNVFC